MSKQLKYKLKKTLKNAEFVHADLEYHQELFAEAKVEFNEEVTRLLKKLPPEEQVRLQEIVERKISEEIAQRMGSAAKKEETEDEGPEITESNCMDLIVTDVEPEDGEIETKVDLENQNLLSLRGSFVRLRSLLIQISWRPVVFPNRRWLD